MADATLITDDERAELAKLRVQVRRLEAELARLRRRPPRKIPAAYTKLGAPPDDPLDAVAWVHRALVVSARRALQDTSITEAEARAELSRTAAQVKDLIPASRLRAAEKAVAAEAAAEAGENHGPEVTHAPIGTAAGDHRPPARRGRPPSGSLR